MKKLMSAFVMVLVFCLVLQAGVACADGKLSTVKKTFFEYEGDDSARFFAKVENSGDAPICIGDGKLVGFSASDDILVSENYISAYPGEIILQPGEYAYVEEYIWESALENDDVADYKFSMEAGSYPSASVTLPCEARFEFAGSYDNYVYVTFTNTEEEIVYGAFVVAALYDADGNLLFVDGEYESNYGVHPGSTVTVKLYIDSDLAEYYEANDITVSEVDAIVYAVERG